MVPCEQTRYRVARKYETTNRQDRAEEKRSEQTKIVSMVPPLFITGLRTPVSLRSEKTHAEQKALGAHEGPRCAGGRLPSGVSLDPLYSYFKTSLTWIKEQEGNCNKIHFELC